MKENEKTENNGNDFFDALLGIAKQATSMSQIPSSVCVNQSRTFNNVKVDVHIVNQPNPGLFRRIFSKLF